MDASDEQFGDVYGGMSIVDKVRLIAAWAPLLGRLEAVAAAKTPQEKGLAIIAALRLAADKTATAKDNNVLDHLEALLKTPEGKAVAEWFAVVVQEIT